MSRTIEVTTDKKVFRVKNIPDNAKITYAGVRPDQPGQKTNTLRIYIGPGQQNQIAVFRDVVEFHDLMLEIQEQGALKQEWM